MSLRIALDNGELMYVQYVSIKITELNRFEDGEGCPGNIFFWCIV